MECTLLLPHQNQLISSPNSMIINPLLSISTKHLLKRKSLRFPLFCTLSEQLENPSEVIRLPRNGKPSTNSKEKIQLIKEKWLFSLSNNGLKDSKNEDEENNVESKWVIGVDPDVSGAVALLKSDVSGIISAQVFDSPIVQVAVGSRLRKRLDARSIVQLLQSFDAPTGTIAYLEQSTPFPQDGKLGWWSGGFGYGLWIGILVASGFSVVPVPSSVWKKELELTGGRTTKDDSRELATQLFPSLSTMLKRKKDHGRAEALLIAAYGNGHKIRTDMVLKLDHQGCETASELEIIETEMDETASELEINETEMDETASELEINETEMDETTSELEINETEMDETASKLEINETKMDETEMDETASELEVNEIEMDETISKLEINETASELEINETEMDETAASELEINESEVDETDMDDCPCEANL